MSAWLRSWILGLAGTATVCAVAALLTPKGRVRRVVQLLTGLLMAAALVQPVLRLPLDGLAPDLTRYRAAAEGFSASGELLRQNLDRAIIERETAAYILDKAQGLGAAVAGAEVTLRWSTEGFWYPAAVTLRGEYHAGLSRLIEAELGVPAEAQRWEANEADGMDPDPGEE